MTHDDAPLPRYAVRLAKSDSESILLFRGKQTGVSKLPRGGRLLADFIRLRRAHDETVLAFAREHGPLRLCALHGKPVGSGDEHPLIGQLGSVVSRFCDVDRTAHGHKEQVAAWRVWARRFDGLHGLARNVATGTETSPARRRALCDDAFYGITYWSIAVRMRGIARRRGDTPDFVAARERRYMASVLNRLIELAPIRPWVRWHPSLSLVGGLGTQSPLFSALVLDLVALASGEPSVLPCQAPECRRFFLPKLGTERYCDAHRGDSRERWKLAQRARRDRLRERGLSARGRPLAGQR